MASREDALYSWHKPSSSTENRSSIIGKGTYGVVFKCDENTVVKIIEAAPEPTTSSAKLAYREHVMSLLQGLLVLQRHNPHFPLHYGFEASPTPSCLSLKFYIEAFDGSLDAHSDVLATANDWVAGIFQISSAILCVASLLSVCHNDLYPRNVLVRRIGVDRVIRYDQFGHRYDVKWSSFLALTDFGVCSSPLLASKSGPEVKKTEPKKKACRGRFGTFSCEGCHILNFKHIPPYSRDLYALFKWPVFGSKGLPAAPQEVRRWSARVLECIDDSVEDALKSPKGTHHVLSFAFSESALQNSSLPSLEADDQIEPDEAYRVCHKDRTPLLAKAARLLSDIRVRA